MRGATSFLPSLVALAIPFAGAVILTLRRPHLRSEASDRRFLAVVGLAILAQALHFVEEFQGRFFVEFPEVLGSPLIEKTVFLWFNLAWLAIWVAALLAVHLGVRVAVLPLWFLALAMLLNLIAHPLLALQVGRYLPGLLTSPVVGVLGGLTVGELTRVTSTEQFQRS